MKIGRLTVPDTQRAFLRRFADEDACVELLGALRFGATLACPRCGERDMVDWRRGFRCRACGGLVSVTAGTALHRSHVALPDWFAAAWIFANSASGVSAVQLRSTLGVGSSRTAHELLARLRRSLDQGQLPRLSRRVEADETFVGGARSAGAGQGGGKPMVLLLVRPGHGCRAAVIPNARAVTLRRELARFVTPRALVVTDGWRPYVGACNGRWRHEARPVLPSGMPAHVLLPAVHGEAARMKRWLNGTHHGAVAPANLQSYLDEWAFRTSTRRWSPSRRVAEVLRASVGRMVLGATASPSKVVGTNQRRRT